MQWCNSNLQTVLGARGSVAMISFLLAATLSAAAGQPVLRVIKPSDPGTPLLQNGDFETLRDARPAHWAGWQNGFRTAPGEGRAGSSCVVCERQEGGGEFGAGQSLALNRTNIAPLISRGWSKALEVSGSPDSGYSLYADVIYADGTPLWGQTADFSCGTHDWEQRQFVLLPDKPIRSLTLHCLFRGHTGKVWFDDISLEEISLPTGALLFQGAIIQKPPANSAMERPSPTRRAPDNQPGVGSEASPPGAAPQRAPIRIATTDGLVLSLGNGTVSSLKIAGRELSADSPSGFLARDFAANSDVYAFAGEDCQALNLKLKTEFSAGGSHVAVAGRLTDTTGTNRAVTLLFALPLDAAGWRWGDDARRSRAITGNAEFADTVAPRCGADGKMSRYPLAAVWNDRAGLALGLDMDHPAQYRLVYHAGTKQFLIAYDFGLTPDTAKFPRSADFRFVIYRFDPRWGFRAALQKYYDLFPQHFARRVRREGVWMPFTDIATVPGFQDFGFAFQEGAPNVAFDDRHDIASFVYVEPASHWLDLPVGTPRTYESALAVLRRDLTGARGRERQEMAAATLTSGIQDAEGRFSLYLVKAPWCDGGMFTLNPEPDVPITPDQRWNKAMVMRETIEAAFRKNQPAGPANPPGAGLDGVYLDSLEMSGAHLNYRRDHFRGAGVPLVFDPRGRPCQLAIFNTWEFTRDIAGRMHQRGKLTFANGALWQFAFPAPLLDVLGTEVNWLRNGEYVPDSDAVMNYRRALCRQKPYCLLMNTDYSRFNPELVERYFQRCLFYGVWPGFFDEAAASKDPYWGAARKWYERDRPLFRKYIPLLQRLTAAGWQPLTYAACDNPAILVERFGPDKTGELYLTLLNDTTEIQNGTIKPDLKALGLKHRGAARELIGHTEIPLADRGWDVSLRPQQAAILHLNPKQK